VQWHAGFGKRTTRRIQIRRDAHTVEEPIFPTVSVCFAYNPQEKGAAATLASLKEQDYPHVEVILAECGSDDSSRPHTLKGENDLKNKTLRRIRVHSSELGGGRNAAARQATGKYLFFVDDHTVLAPVNALSIFVQVAERVGADILTSAISFFLGTSGELSNGRQEHSRRPFLGGDVATGAFVNCFGSINALVRRDAFVAIGGFSNEAGTTLDEWELFSKAALMGLRIETMPEVYVWYREDQDQESLVHSLVNAAVVLSPILRQGARLRRP
jgi:GT2 family glycosyltransferase